MIDKDEVGFASFGKPFQEKLAQLIVEDAAFAGQVGEVLNTHFFELKYLQVFVQKIYDFKEEYDRYPAKASIESYLRTDLDDENEVVKKQVREFFARVESGNVKNLDPEFVKDKSLDFCRKQKLKEAMIKSVKLMERADFDEISAIINGALKLGASNDIGYEFIEQFEDRYSFKKRSPISTGWDILDGYTKGGLGSGDLGVVIAPTGAGKSMLLVAMAAAALKAGKNVVYYTLELSDEMTGLRFDSCLTGERLDDLEGLKEQVFEDIADVPGKLIIKEYPTKSATTDTIKSHLTKLKQRNFEPDMMIVDYGDLLRPRRFSKEKREDLESIYEELRGIAKEFGIPCWTASQTNRSGLNAEVITMESISEAFSKCFVADFIFSCSRTIQDKTTNTGRFFIAKNRYGPDGIILPIYMDTGRVDIDVFPATGDTMQDLKEQSASAQKTRLAEKYEKYKHNNKK
jgi:hypothetical protein